VYANCWWLFIIRWADDCALTLVFQPSWWRWVTCIRWCVFQHWLFIPVDPHTPALQAEQFPCWLIHSDVPFGEFIPPGLFHWLRGEQLVHLHSPPHCFTAIMIRILHFDFRSPFMNIEQIHQPAIFYIHLLPAWVFTWNAILEQYIQRWWNKFSYNADSFHSILIYSYFPSIPFNLVIDPGGIVESQVTIRHYPDITLFLVDQIYLLFPSVATLVPCRLPVGLDITVFGWTLIQIVYNSFLFDCWVILPHHCSIVRWTRFPHYWLSIWWAFRFRWEPSLCYSNCGWFGCYVVLRSCRSILIICWLDYSIYSDYYSIDIVWLCYTEWATSTIFIPHSLLHPSLITDVLDYAPCYNSGVIPATICCSPLIWIQIQIWFNIWIVVGITLIRWLLFYICPLYNSGGILFVIVELGTLLRFIPPCWLPLTLFGDTLWEQFHSNI